MRHAALLLTLLLAPGIAEAQKKPSPLSEVKRDLADGEFERALKKADAALKRSTDASELAQLHLVRGQALLALGKPDKARGAFSAALQKDLTVELDPARASPDAVKLLEKARAELPATLSVRMADGEAKLTVDDKDMGPAPLQMQISAGPHVVEARASDGRSARQEVQIAPGRKTEITLSLAAALKTPVVEHRPELAPTPPPQPPDVPPLPPPAVVEQPRPARSKAFLGPLIGGAVIGVAGGVALWQANVEFSRLTAIGGPLLTPTQEAAAVANGKLFQTLGWVGVGVGAAAIATGVVMLALPSSAARDDSSDARLGVVVTPGGVWVGVQGRLP